VRLLQDDPEADWTLRGVYEVSPGLYRVPLPLPNDALRAVNVYVVHDGDSLVLVDSGWALAESTRIIPSVDGSATRPEPQGHKPAIARNRRVLPVPEAPTMTTRSPCAISPCCSLSMVRPVEVATSRFSKVTFLPGP
jgi:hypothetical protein